MTDDQIETFLAGVQDMIRCNQNGDSDEDAQALVAEAVQGMRHDREVRPEDLADILLAAIASMIVAKSLIGEDREKYECIAKKHALKFVEGLFA